DRRGEIQRAVERYIESGEAQYAERGKQRQLGADCRPVCAQSLPANDVEYSKGETPSPQVEQQRRDMADRELAGDSIAAPEQGCQEEKGVGFTLLHTSPRHRTARSPAHGPKACPSRAPHAGCRSR